MPEVPVAPGSETTEYKEAKETGFIGKLMVVLGMLVTFGGSVAQILGVDSKAGIIAGAVVVIAGALVKMFSGLGYTKARAIVKASAAAAVAKVAADPNDSAPTP